MLRNDDVDWDRWPVTAYVDEVYGRIQPADDAVMAHHAAALRNYPPDHFGRSLELGAGPNLYPLMLAAAVSREIEVVEPSASSVAYLRDQVLGPVDDNWEPFYDRCRDLLPALPEVPAAALARVRVRRGSVRDLTPGAYDLASMHFVAESATEDADEFRAMCHAWVRSARPGGLLIAAFMENMGTYRIADGPEWPAYPVDEQIVRDTFAPLTTALDVCRIDDHPTSDGYATTGMVLLTAHRRDDG